MTAGIGVLEFSKVVLVIFVGAVLAGLGRRVGRAQGTDFNPRVLAVVAVARDDRIGDVVAHFDGRPHRAADPGAVGPVADAQLVLYRGQCDVGNRIVEHQHQLSGCDDEQGNPGSPARVGFSY